MLRPPPRSPLFPYTTLFRSGLIAQSQLRYLDRRIVRHAEEELGPHVVVFVLERGAASAVSNAIASVRDRRWCRAPQVTAVVVLQKKNVADRIRHRIVMPRRQPIELRILRPGTAGPTLRYDESAKPVGDHIDPRSRGKLRVIHEHLIVAGRIQSADAVEVPQTSRLGGRFLIRIA